MNKIILIGNLTRDPDANTTAGGVNFTRFTIAVNRIYANAAGERVADYFDVIAWRNVGELCAKYLAKGSKVGITGRVQRRNYEDRDGIKRTSFDVVADEVEFLTPKTSARPGDPPQDVVADLTPVDHPEDLPF